MSAARAVAFDFNGTLSHDEPILYAVYREMFSAWGRLLSADDYYGALAGLSEEEIIGTCFGVEGEALAALVEERIERPVLAGAGLDRHVELIVAAEDVERGKPDPAGYVRAVELLGRELLPSEVVALEDTEAGVASAKAAGLRCVAVLGTHPPERLRGADEIVEAIDVDLVRRLLE